MAEFLVEFYLLLYEAGSAEAAHRTAALAAVTSARVSQVVGDIRPGTGPATGNMERGERNASTW